MSLTTAPEVAMQTTELACGTRDAAAACVDLLREVVAGLDPDVLMASDAPEVWALFDQGERLCNAAKVLVAHKVEESSAWRDAGVRSAAEYLALRGGTTRETAREELRSSKRLGDLPQVQDAVRRGELSGAQIRVVADAASHDPTAQSALLDHAKVASFKELRDECLRRKAAADPKPQDTQDRIHKDRYFRLSTDAEGAWRFSGRGPLHHAGTFGATLNPLIDDLYKQARAEGRREARDAYAYDAVQEMARLARAAYYGDELPDDDTESIDDLAECADDPGSADDDGTDSIDDPPLLPGRNGPGADAGAAPGAGRTGRKNRAKNKRQGRKRRANPSHLAILRLDVEALRRGYTQGDELCEVSGVGPVPVDAARGLLGDAIVKLVLTKGTAVANVVHLGRGPTVAQRMALLWAQPECSVEECPSTFTQIDHRHDWHLIHETALHNLDRLCPHHHRLKTYEGWALVPGTGKRSMVPPGDHRHPGPPPAKSSKSRSGSGTSNPPSTTSTGNSLAPPRQEVRGQHSGRSWLAA